MTDKKAITPAEALPEAYVIACLLHGDWRRAVDLLEEFGPLPAYAPHIAGAAARLLSEGKHEEAIEAASRAIELDPACGLAQSVLGRALLEAPVDQREGTGGVEERFARAESALRRAAELDPQEIPARTALASLYSRQGRPLDARPFVEQALTTAPWDPEARESLKRLRKAVEAIVPRGDPAVEELRRLAGQVHQRCANARPPTVSLCLITRNEVDNLPRVIESVRGLATEVIVVDTGSTDDTIKVARRLGARVDQFTWVNDFAAARNHSLKLATGEWILVLDADDEFSRGSTSALRQWLRHAPEVGVVGLYRRYPYPGANRDSVSVVPRLFRNGRGFRYEGAIHERLITAEGQDARPEITLTVTHYHHGVTTTEDVEGRHERNLPILLDALERQPNDPRMLYYVGITHYEREQWTEAIPYLEETIRTLGKEVDLTPKVYGCLGFALMKANRPLEAETRLRQGLEWYPHYPGLWFCLGMVLDGLGRLDEAVAAHEAALRGRFGPSLNWHDWDCRESRPHLALCDLRLSMGDPDAASCHLEAAERFTGPKPHYHLIRQAIDETRAEQLRRGDERERQRSLLMERFHAGDVESGIPLVELMLESGPIKQALELTDTWVQRETAVPEALIARGIALLASGAAAQALSSFLSACEIRPDPRGWRGQADAFRALGRTSEAEEALRHALSLNPGDGQAEQQLGELYLAQERWDEATRCFQRSLARRDDLWSTWLGLGKALLRVGNLPVAINCYQRAATLSGGNPAVRIALGEARACLAHRVAS